MYRRPNVIRLALLAATLSLAARCAWTFTTWEPQQTGLRARRGAAATHVGSRTGRAALGPFDSLSLPEWPAWLPTPSLPTVSQPVWDEITKVFLETVIAWGVPAITIGLVGGAIAAGIGSKLAQEAGRDRRLRRARVAAGGSGGGGMVTSLLGGGGDEDEDIGAPKEFLKVERINDRYESFAFSLEKATGAPATALAGARRRDLQRRFGEEIGSLNDAQLADFVRLEGEYKAAAKAAAEEVEDASRELRLFAVEGGGPMSASAKGSSEGGKDEKKDTGKSEMPMMRMFRGQDLEKKLAKAIKNSVTVEAKYLQQVSKALGGKEASEERLGLARLVSDRPFVWDPKVSPLELPHKNLVLEHGVEAVLEKTDTETTVAPTMKRKPTWFVLEFFGDVQASQVSQLRQEVTAVVEAANPANGDGVVLILNTGGGTVTGYGLAAAQLMRIKKAGLPLTICVEQVAASGGYMMACCADRLVSSPFAVVGSIGVITDIPNVYDRLQKEGIEFQTITAGKFKRTLTPTKKVTDEDKAKTTEDIEAIFRLFRDFVASQRPKLEIEQVATGETWFGQDALERKLVDELISSDDVLVNLCKQGCELYSVKYAPQPTSPLAALIGASSQPAESLVSTGGAAGSSSGGMSWWAKRLFEFATSTPAGALDAFRKQSTLASRPDQLYRAEDNSSQDFRM